MAGETAPNPAIAESSRVGAVLTSDGEPSTYADVAALHAGVGSLGSTVGEESHRDADIG